MNEEQENKQQLTITGNKQLIPIANNPLASIDSMMEYAKKLVSADSKLVPYTEAGDVLIVLQAAKDFNITVSAALGNIHPIGGKASAGIHVIQALCLKAGITVEVLAELSPVYAYTGQGGRPVTHNEVVANPKNYNFINEKTPREEYSETLINIKVGKVIDLETRVKLTRMLKQPDGKWKEISIVGAYKQTDAQRAGLLASDTWAKYFKAMMYKSAYMEAAKRIADDILLGLVETAEMAEVYDIPYEVDNRGDATIVHNID